MDRHRYPALNLLPAAIALALASASNAVAPLPRELARAVDDYNRATIGKDVTALSALVTNDYVLVNSDASVQDKASYLADFKVAGFAIEPYRMEQPVTKVNRDSALTSWTMRLRWTQGGKAQSRKLRIAHWWVKQGGRWRISYTQLTRVPD